MPIDQTIPSGILPGSITQVDRNTCNQARRLSRRTLILRNDAGPETDLCLRPFLTRLETAPLTCGARARGDGIHRC